MRNPAYLVEENVVQDLEWEEEQYKEQFPDSRDDMWETLRCFGVSEQTLRIVTSINGYSEETLLDVLYAFTGYRSFEQVNMSEYGLETSDEEDM